MVAVFDKFGAVAARVLLVLSLLSMVAALPVTDEQINGLRDPELIRAIRNPRLGFLTFLKRFGKTYTGDAFKHRLKIFSENLLLAVEHQLGDPTAVHGISMFADLTPEEFAAGFLGVKSPPDAMFPARTETEDLPTDDLPDEFDWRDLGAVTPVKNQGMCGSCYAFSAVQALEGAHFLSTGELLKLSPQQVVDCDTECDPQIHEACDSGCAGGLMNNVFSYLEKVGGVELESDYPYLAHQSKCRFDQSRVKAQVADFKSVPVKDDQIAAHLLRYGPLAVALNAGWMQTYVRGVSCPLLCDPKALNHGVLLVGYGKQGFSPARLKHKDHWIIKNSWGPGWGEAGYYKLCRGHDECGIDTMVSAVVAVGNTTRSA